jgi:hypothetical protein
MVNIGSITNEEPPLMPTAANTQNTVAAAIDRMIERLLLVKAAAPNPIRIFPSPDDFLEISRLFRDVGEIFNDFARAVGDEVENNSPYHVDSRSFDNVVTDAIGDCAYACEAIAERLQDEREAA